MGRGRLNTGARNTIRPVSVSKAPASTVRTPASKPRTVAAAKPKTQSKGGYHLDSVTKNLLKAGNEYAFALELLKAHPSFAKQENFDLGKAINSYRAYIEYNDGIYTFWGKNGTKYFFDTDMRIRGASS